VPGVVQLVSEHSIEGFDLEINGYPCHFNLPGEHNLANVRAAVAAAMEIGIDAELIARGINHMKPLFGRGELLKGDITVMRDCYNANPDSTEQSLKLLRFWSGRSVVILGDMLELGEAGIEEHRRIGEIAADSGAEAVFLFGEEMEEAFEAIGKTGYPGYSFWTVHFEDLEAAVREYVQAGDFVLLKGSRGVALERLTPLLTGRKSI